MCVSKEESARFRSSNTSTYLAVQSNFDYKKISFYKTYILVQLTRNTLIYTHAQTVVVSESCTSLLTVRMSDIPVQIVGGAENFSVWTLSLNQYSDICSLSVSCVLYRTKVSNKREFENVMTVHGSQIKRFSLFQQSPGSTYLDNFELTQICELRSKDNQAITQI